MEAKAKVEHEVAIALEAAKTILVFDYFGSHQKVLTELLHEHPDYAVVMFATRNHPDLSRHSMFEIMQQRDPIYVLTNDIPARIIPSTARVQGMSHGDVVELPVGQLTVRAYAADDNAVSYLVESGATGEKIFYGGLMPQHSVNRLAEDAPKIDVAFTPAVQQPLFGSKVNVVRFVDID